jgi:hypothetical protein
VPPRVWTAWPLKPKQVPKNNLINSQHDEDDCFTFCKQEQTLPSTELEEELSATILRTAKRRFNHRKRKIPRRSIEATVERIQSDDDVPGPSSRETSIKPEFGYEDEEMHDTDVPGSITGHPSESKTYEPVVSANDDLSYDLLRPSVRHILSQLDDTLTILHNSRVAGLSYLSDSSTEDESDAQGGQKRPRGRPRNSSQVDANSSGADAPKTPTRRGRPRKVHTPKEGESHDDMLHRVAREGHRKLPTTPKDSDAAFDQWMQRTDEAIERERSLSSARSRHAAFDQWMQRTDEVIERERSTSLARSRHASQGVDTESEASSGGNDRDRRLSRWGLRGWSDVLGAAALAGFPSDVIARTTKRCADLFGEGMVVRKLNEAPVSNGAAIETVEFRPQPIRLSSCESDADGESDGEADVVQRRVASRQVSVVRSSHDRSSPESIRGRLSRTQSPAPTKSPRSRSRSRSSTAGVVFCPISSCGRALQGFTRKANLRRHIELVHQGQTEEMDSDDEMVGAVHVDGFLRPIVPGRGWRGEDAITRKRKRYYGQSSKKGSRAPSSEREA